MKSWIQLLVVGAAFIGVLGYTNEEIVEICMKENSVTRQELIDEKYSASADQRIKCFYACTAKITGWLTDDGELIRDKLFKPLSEIPRDRWPEVDALAQTCLKKSKDPCDTAYSVQKCLQSQMTSKK